MTDNHNLIEGKVAKVLTSRQVALNIGSNHGVEVGMKFEILSIKGENIKDPDTGETLGSISMPKARVEIIEVREKLSIGRTFEKKEVNVGGKGPDIGDLAEQFMPPKWIEKHQTLKTDEATWEDIDESESYVNKGDPVRQIPIPKEIKDEE